ncbi:unnamed protein product [Penicillium salamii]|uniref:Carrier domain-containing protein n=1 Tax=Penicillium salamii TaxID=1612424 RepID=A0A9W4JK81_9EURO|nr:unnamed protein product [Penicillium salamii]CAG8140888.1 unnamed protein product [Penicillium salamii]CAG8155376.1 unnamed protein product [Penicillium salamii]CAG8157836.1 unnamed protein product [Penicillium salamii]CAG8160003.1 unnamed protein product [Penicillium salamii]
MSIPSSKRGSEDDLAGFTAQSCMNTPIAIVGMAFRGPAEASNVNRLWEMILAGREGWSPIPAKRWNNEAFYHPHDARHGSINVQGGHFLEEDISAFDAPFFNMTGDEAAAMDPQQRLLLEVTYEGLENAGISLNTIAGTETSCFVGSFSADYTDLLLRDPECVPMYQCTNAGQSRAMTANRLSYFFDLKGPSVTVDTACSGSLVALHLACQSLQTGDASTAIAAGVNLILSHEFMSTMSMMRFLSPDGRCHTFDEKANGYARGEAAGCLILKPLAKALHDGNTIRAVIRGTGSNQDGRTAGIALPNRVAQENLIRSVYQRTGLDPAETDFVEAHGTGTQAGDPLETKAISEVFCARRSVHNPVRIGSIKTNVGHLEGASGVAGVIKAVLMLENRMFLPNRNFEKINPRIPLDEWKLKIQLSPEYWQTKGPRRVSVNSFGYGGSNAHAILEETESCLSGLGLEIKRSSSKVCNGPRDRPLSISSHQTSRVYVLSGFDEASCARQVQNLRSYILHKNSQPIRDRFLDNLAFTVNERRTLFPWKIAVVGSDLENLNISLSQRIKARSAVRKPRLGFVFTGQGAQWAGMGRELIPAYPVFKDSILRIDGALKEVGCGFGVMEELQKAPEDSNLNHPSLSQTICTALQIALVDLLASWGIYPDSVTGHSSGEIPAAYAAGALSMKDAMTVALNRGLSATQLLDQPVKGTMIAVGLSVEEVQRYLDLISPSQLVVGCINSPSSVTISGDAPAVEGLEKVLKDHSIFTKRLEVGVAYHSPHMNRVAEQYRSSINHIQALDTADVKNKTNPVVPRFFSSVSGTQIHPSELNCHYWVSNLTGPVNFASSLRALCFETLSQRPPRVESTKMKRSKPAQKPSVDILLEIGPHSGLAGPIKQILRADTKLSSADIVYVNMLTRNTNALTTALNAAATVASLNYPVSFKSINRPHHPLDETTPELLVDLPPYSWDHTRTYWAEPRLSKMYRNRPTPRMDLIGAPDNIACPFEPRWRNHLRTSELPWLLDHKIQGSIIFPAAGYLTMVIEAVKQMATAEDDFASYILQNIEIKSALVLNEISAIEVMTSLSKPLHSQSHLYDFHIYSISDDNRWTEHCSGIVGRQKSLGVSKEGSEDADGYVMVPLGAEVHGISVVDIGTFYDKLHSSGLEYGRCFMNLTEARVTQDGACFADITVPDTRSVMPASFQHDLLIHPCTLDSIFHTIIAALPLGMGVEEGPVIPISIEEMVVSSRLNCLSGELMSICTHVRPVSGGNFTACIAVVDYDKKFEMEPSISIRGLRCARLGRQKSVSSGEGISTIYQIDWKPDYTFLCPGNPSALLAMGELEEKPVDLNEHEYHAAEYIRAAFEQIGADEAMDLDISHRRLWCYLQDVLERYDKEESPMDLHFENPGPAQIGHLLHTIGSNLVSIIRNQIEYSAVIENESLLLEYWDMFAADEAYQAAANYVGLIGHKNPAISILEFGVGIGQIAEIFLKRLIRPDGSSCCAKYTFAHESALTLEQTSKQLKQWQDWVECKLLDLRADFSSQGVKKGSFDVIILPHGLCTARCEQDALSRINDLLTPSGFLIAINPFDPKESVLKSVLFGALHCLSADEFCLGQSGWTEGQWTEILNDAKFSAVDIFAEQDSYKCHQFIVAKKQSADLLTARSANVAIIDEEKSGDLAVELVNHLKKRFSKVIMTKIEDLDPEGQICLVLDTAKSSLLASPDKLTLKKIQAIFTHSSGVLWVTTGGIIEPENPDAGLVSGFARTARAESGVKPIVTLDLDSCNPLSGVQSAELISRLLVTRFFYKGSDLDTEYVERNGVLLIPRVVKDVKTTLAMEKVDQTESVHTQIFHNSDQPLRLSGKNNSSTFVPDHEIHELPVNHIGIEVHAFGLSRGDIVQDMEYWEQDDTLGIGCSGVVYEVGSEVRGFKKGDRVACLGAGTARTFYHDRGTRFQRIRGDMAFQFAASLPLAYTVALYAVTHLAHVEPSETVLVDDAGSYLGQAIVDICLFKHTRLFAIARSSHEKTILASKYGIPEERIFLKGEDDTLKGILRLTDGKKASAVFAFDASNGSVRNCTAPFGRFVQLRTESHQPHYWTESQNVTISTLNISDFQKERKDLVDKIWLDVARLFCDRRLNGPASIQVYPVSSVGEAIDATSTDQQVLVSAKASDTVQVTLPKKPHQLFQENASYLLVGGLGGIGQETALWMAHNGAKSIIFISRSGLSNEKSKATVKELMERGVQVTIRACDISDESSVSHVLGELSKCAPPIRGLIQAAMVLKDVHIENMQPDEYYDVISPKYHGTWNLHRNLPSDLDFFVMLSSISGVIGNATQAAYAAGCAFQDSFAAYRQRLGLAAVSLDLGVISDAGYLAENKELAKKMKRQGFQGMNTKTLMGLIQVAISQPPNERTQIITGLGRWKEGESLGNFDESIFSHFRHQFGGLGEPSSQTSSELLKAALNSAKTTDQATGVICEAISQKLASHLSIPVENIDSANRVSDYGVDSHVAIELRDWISRSMACTIPILEILAKSLLDLSFRVASEIFHNHEE